MHFIYSFTIQQNAVLIRRGNYALGVIFVEKIVVTCNEEFLEFHFNQQFVPVFHPVGCFSCLIIFCILWKNRCMEFPSQKAVVELQEIYRKEFDVELTYDAAKAEARRLLIFFRELLLLEQKIADNSLSTTSSSQTSPNMVSS
ncbi:MAG: hypothetical protein H6696_14250 [Deferribacteres bacterium]|nr:hypothetical protein [candidate division KSB1 bacterium]MCB9503090.1 hypothetical protein [Deferribacteres bacterium]